MQKRDGGQFDRRQCAKSRIFESERSAHERDEEMGQNDGVGSSAWGRTPVNEKYVTVNVLCWESAVQVVFREEATGMLGEGLHDQVSATDRFKFGRRRSDRSSFAPYEGSDWQS